MKLLSRINQALIDLFEGDGDPYIRLLLILLLRAAILGTCFFYLVLVLK